MHEEMDKFMSFDGRQRFSAAPLQGARLVDAPPLARAPFAALLG